MWTPIAPVDSPRRPPAVMTGDAPASLRDPPPAVVVGPAVDAATDPAAARDEAPNPWAPDSDYVRRFDPDGLVTILGDVAAVSTFRPGAGAIEGLLLEVQTDEGPVRVHTGPRPYVLAQAMRFSFRDRVRVTGSYATIDGQRVLIAAVVARNGRVLRLRDAKGRPVWPDDPADLAAP